MKTATATIATTIPRRPRAERARVLVVLHPDGYVEVFADRQQVDVHVAAALAVEQSQEALAEEYLDATLPPLYRSLHLPRNLIAFGQVAPRTAEQELQRRAEFRIVRELRELHK